MTSLTLVFLCQLAGELLVGALGLPVPGPVIGMGLMFAGLTLRGSVPDELARVGDVLLSHLSLLFVPAGVGVMVHAALIGRDWAPIALALVVSTIVALVVTALVMRAVGAARGGPRP